MDCTAPRHTHATDDSASVIQFPPAETKSERKFSREHPVRQVFPAKSLRLFRPSMFVSNQNLKSLYLIARVLSMAMNLGFLTIVQENGSYQGGYLVTNLWGRPLEFRLSSAVQPNR